MFAAGCAGVIVSGWCCLYGFVTFPELACPCGSSLLGLLCGLWTTLELTVVVDPLAEADVAALVVAVGAIAT